jgi:dinuclear metal center YbgI/SA1388 family protein
MIPLDDLATYLDSALRLADFEDYPNALNGLQVENGGEINKVAAAVDACEATISAAVEAGADLLLVHHGLFWGGLAPVTGASYRKMRLAIENGLAIYSVHLPLDAHPEVGNNVLFCEALKLKNHREPFFPVKGRPIGIRVEEKINREVLHNRIEVEVGGRVILAPGGPVSTGHIGIVTGGAGSDLAKAAAEGIDTFITGEAPHWCYSAAEELGINLFLAGHYATETYGVKALGEHIGERFHIEYEFIDHPSGL